MPCRNIRTSIFSRILTVVPRFSLRIFRGPAKRSFETLDEGSWRFELVLFAAVGTRRDCVVHRVAPLSSGSYFCMTRQCGARFACPVRGRTRFRLGFYRGTTKMHEVMNSSTRMVNSCSLILVAKRSLRRI